MEDSEQRLDEPEDRGVEAEPEPMPADAQHRRQDEPIAGRDAEHQQDDDTIGEEHGPV